MKVVYHVLYWDDQQGLGVHVLGAFEHLTDALDAKETWEAQNPDSHGLYLATDKQIESLRKALS